MAVRFRVVMIACVALLPVVAADHPLTIVLSDWASGEWLVGTPVALPEPAQAINEDRFALDVPECHREILLDVLFNPNETAADVAGVGSVSVAHELRASLWNATDEIGSVRIFREGFSFGVALAPEAGPHELRLRLATGADVNWTARVRGHLLQDEPGCSHVVG